MVTLTSSQTQAPAQPRIEIIPATKTRPTQAKLTRKDGSKLYVSID